MLQVNDSNFDQLLAEGKPMVVDFWATWCGPCQMLSPVVQDVAKESDNLKVAKINIDQEEDLAVRYEIASIPTLVVIRNGNEIKRSTKALV